MYDYVAMAHARARCSLDAKAEREPEHRRRQRQAQEITRRLEAAANEFTAQAEALEDLSDGKPFTPGSEDAVRLEGRLRPQRAYPLWAHTVYLAANAAALVFHVQSIAESPNDPETATGHRLAAMPSQINLITMTYHGRRPLGPESRPRLGLPCPGVDEAETAARAALSMMEAGYTPHRVVQHRPINISLGAYEWGEDLCARLSDQQEEGLEEGDNPDITIDWGDAQDVYNILVVYRNHGIAYAKLFHEHYQDSVDEYGAITINARLLARLPAFIDKDRRYDRAAEINQMIYHNVGLCLEELHATPPKVFAALAATMSEAGLSQSQQRTIMLNLAPENPGAQSYLAAALPTGSPLDEKEIRAVVKALRDAGASPAAVTDALLALKTPRELRRKLGPRRLPRVRWLDARKVLLALKEAAGRDCQEDLEAAAEVMGWNRSHRQLEDFLLEQEGKGRRRPDR